jgi:hypothetical protein
MAKQLFVDRYTFPLYLERELMDKVINASLDLGISSNAYIRQLIIKDLKKNERNSK